MNRPSINSNNSIRKAISGVLSATVLFVVLKIDNMFVDPMSSIDHAADEYALSAAGTVVFGALALLIGLAFAAGFKLGYIGQVGSVALTFITIVILQETQDRYIDSIYSRELVSPSETIQNFVLFGALCAAIWYGSVLILERSDTWFGESSTSPI